MDIGLRTPLLDFFRRGEVALDVRLLAARGALVPDPLEQLALLALMTDDPDPEVCRTAEATLGRIPPPLVASFLARPEVPDELRAFFAGRGISPAAAPPSETARLLDAEGDEVLGLAEADGGSEHALQQLQGMTVPQKIKAAMKGSREVRALLVRDPNRIVAAAVLSSPKLSDQEVESFARMANVSEDVLRVIGQNRSWTKSYAVVAALVKNPKTPVAVSLTLLPRLNDRDLRALAIDRNVPEPLRLAARRKVVQSGG